ncbi:hypothetical protein OSTOST_10626, partial [Ostertagia ostertagi]
MIPVSIRSKVEASTTTIHEKYSFDRVEQEKRSKYHPYVIDSRTNNLVQETSFVQPTPQVPFVQPRPQTPSVQQQPQAPFDQRQLQTSFNQRQPQTSFEQPQTQTVFSQRQPQTPFTPEPTAFTQA